MRMGVVVGKSILAKLPQTLLVKQVAYDHESVAAKDACRAFDLVGRTDLKPPNAIIVLEICAQAFHFRIIVSAPHGSPGIRDAETGSPRRRIAVFIHCLVDARIFVPTDTGFAVDGERLKFFVHSLWLPHSAVWSA